MKSFREAVKNIFEINPDFQWLTIINPQGKKSYTIRELVLRINDYYIFYEKNKIKENDTILIILKESLDLFASFFAGIIYGALPAYFAYPSPKQSKEAFLQAIDNLIQYNDVKIVIGFKEVVEILSHTSRIKGNEFSGYFDHELIMHNNILDSNIFSNRAREAFLQFSSGTTGAKKGVKISTEALFNQIMAYSPFVKFDSESKIVSWLPHYHDMGLIACMLIPFLKRIPIYMMSPFEWVKNPRMLFQATTEFKCTHLWLPNFALGHLTKSIPDSEIQNYNLSSVKQLVCCSEPALFETVAKFIEKFEKSGFNRTSIYNCYAMAENTFAMTSTDDGIIKFIEIDQKVFQSEQRIEVKPGGKKISCAGIPLPNINIRIVNDENQNLSENFVGEVILKSDCMLDCYHNNPEETAKAVVDGWFKTGDLGFLHEGELYITGRKKDIIIVAGENIYPQDIELILNEEKILIPGRNVVFGVNDERIGTEKVVIIAETNEKISQIDTLPIKKKIFDNLNISVSEIVLLPHMSLKKGTAGKISRYLNKNEYLSGTFDVYSEKIERDELKELVLSIIPSRIKPQIQFDTSLFNSGLIDSFAFIDLINEIEKKYTIKIPESYMKIEYFESLQNISNTINILKADSDNKDIIDKEKIEESRKKSLCRLEEKLTVIPGKLSFVEWIINHNPLHFSFIYKILFKMAGIKIGKKLIFLGKVKIRIRGKAGNIQIGDNVILGNGVDLRNRENGRIILHDRVYLDDGVRLVAARDGKIEIGFGTEIGFNTSITSGGITEIGKFAMISGFVNINSSRHGTDIMTLMKEQAHSHGFIKIGDDVWIGAGAAVIINSTINDGAIVAANSLVSGEISSFAFCAGVPAKIIKYR